jgi:hypothetical protein
MVFEIPCGAAFVPAPVAVLAGIAPPPAAAPAIASAIVK